jgi:hypothetical protein
MFASCICGKHTHTLVRNEKQKTTYEERATVDRQLHALHVALTWHLKY